jgi:hypothetical protein
MALETLIGVKQIGGFEVLQSRPIDAHGQVMWDLFDEMRKTKPIYIDHDVSMISFRVQNKPIREVGVNGCQVQTIIETAKLMIEELNKKFPCRENAMIITKLDEAVMWSKKRTDDRIAREVEGLNKA